MLRALEIRDLLLIDQLRLEFKSGLNVLTGETGAGKSILLDALGFVLGWRGRADLVRQGAEQGEVTAVFELPQGHPALAILKEAGIASGAELLLRRVNNADGRKTAWVNDRRASGEVLRALSATLVELHGQHDDQGLLNTRGHRQMLDSFAGLDLSALREAWKGLAGVRKAKADANAALLAARAEEDYLRHAVAELDRIDPQPGEEAELDAHRRAMQAAEKIRGDIARACQALSEQGAEAMMRDAQRWLEDASDKAGDRLEAPLSALGRAMIELGEAHAGVENLLGELSFDPNELDQVEERLFAIRALARKHNVLADDLNLFAEDLRSRLTALDSGERDLAALAGELRAAEAAYAEAAEALSAARRRAAGQLDKAMSKELSPLKMERALFETRIEPAEAGPEGADQVHFTVATNPGAPPGPLNRIASGGELSRFLLALKVCLTGDMPGLTMIFDELDRGVGGATADAVGRRLATLSRRAQVLAVTHSPQVAALASYHWRVEKRVEGGMTTSFVTPLNAAQRVEEIARMLAGDTVTPAAREAARALLI
ncbi:MAG: DNA repair protein RecN [Pseudorhodobacter sp.]